MKQAVNTRFSFFRALPSQGEDFNFNEKPGLDELMRLLGNLSKEQDPFLSESEHN